MDLPMADGPTKMHCVMSIVTEPCLLRASLYAAGHIGLAAEKECGH